MDLIDSLVRISLETLQFELRYNLKRRVNACIYHTHKTARKFLNRDVPDTMAMAPYHSHTDALIVLHSPSVNPLNGNIRRMRRILTHELCHAFLAERSGSTKILGDNNNGKRIPTWFDEGFSEYMALTLNHELLCLQAMLSDASSLTPMTDVELNQSLDNPGAECRNNAFAITVTKINEMVKKKGLRTLFREDAVCRTKCQ